MKSPKISVIIPIYNTEKYLKKCLDSVVGQTFKDLEIICVDDCSPDNSREIIKEYQTRDSRIVFIRHEYNLGQGGARNTAILAAKADFIASVDSDDSIQPDMIERLWAASNDGKLDVVCCGYTRVSEDGYEISKKEFKVSIVNFPPNKINIFTLLNPAIWNKLWRKSLFIDNDIFYPNKLYYQDMATTPLLVAKAEKIGFIDDCLYNYLVREGSVTTTFTPKHIIDYFKVYEILYEFLKRNDILDKYLSDFIDYINEGMRFHSANVLASHFDEREKKQYLRHLLMMKNAFMESHSALESKTPEELRLLLSDAGKNHGFGQQPNNDSIRVIRKLLGLTKNVY